MTDNRNTILAVVLSGLVLLGWQYFFNIPAMEKQRQQAQIQSHEGGYFIRLKVLDKTGVFASIATRMAENRISLESIVQHSKQPVDTDGPQTIILVTHATTEDSVRKAVASIKGEGYLVGEPQVIRIERPKED